ncbi:MAG: TrbC family F-type conjugative pilus assembly protein [Candidatus Porifericomitaceae bacterium WSBS_2022_MAG_OTU9]
MRAHHIYGALRTLSYVALSVVTLHCVLGLPFAHAAQTEQSAAPSRLLVFISLSMPAAQLRSIASEARRLQAVLLLRSFPNTNSTTAKSAYQALFTDGDSTNIQVDPFLFYDYAVAMVPVYILSLQAPGKTKAWPSGDCGQQLHPCPSPQPIARVAGAASISEALRYMGRKQQAKAAATALMEQLGAPP